MAKPEEKHVVERQFIQELRALLQTNLSLKLESDEIIDLVARYKGDHPSLPDLLDDLDMASIMFNARIEIEGEGLQNRLRSLREGFKNRSTELHARVLELVRALSSHLEARDSNLHVAMGGIERQIGELEDDLKNLEKRREVLDPDHNEEAFRSEPDFISYRGEVMSAVTEEIRKNKEGFNSPNITALLSRIQEDGQRYSDVVNWEQEIRGDADVKLEVLEKIFEKHGFADLFVKESVQKQEVVTAAATVDMRDLLDEDGSDDDIQGVVSNEEGDGKEMTMLSPDMISKPDEFFENMKNNIRFPHQDRNRKANTPEEYQLEAGHPLIDKAKPKNHYTIAGVDYYISDPFTVYKRKAFSLYVKFPDDDQYYARVAYKSGSNNVWRTVSNYVNGWFGKGRETEESVTFPHQMQGILEQLSRDEDIEFENGDLDEDKKPGELLFGSLVAWDISVSDTFVYDADKVREDEDRTKKIGGFIGEGPESYQYFEGYEPDYSSVKEDDRFKVFSQTLDRDIDAYVLDSENGELSYLFYHDAENDVTWIGSVQVKEIDFNRYGVNENTISSSCLEVHNMRAGKIKDNLIMPGYEYGSQIPDGYAGDRTKGSYCDASKYTHKLPPVAGFREEVLGLEPEAGVVRQDFSHTTQVGLDTTMMRRQAQEIKERDREAKRKKRVYHIFEKIFTEDELRAGITIGRSKGNDIEIVDEAVSREHAVIILRGENIVLQDMESTNGTVVDSTRVKDGAEELIKPGAVLSIMLGDKQFAKSEFTSYRPVTNKTKKLKKSEEYFFEIDGEFIDSSYFHEEQILAGIITMVLDDDGLFFKHDSNQDILINGVKLLKGQRCKLKPGDKFKIDDSEESEFKIYIKDNK